jgi:hypothetical protein
MARKFYNEATDFLFIIHENAEGATTAILGDETKVTDEEIFALYNGDDVAGFAPTL